MGLKISNNSESTLNGGINASVTTLDVQVGHGARFPYCAAAAGDYFYCTITDITGNREVIKVTQHDNDSDTFQVIERSADYIQDTANTAYAFADGDVIQLRLPAVAILGPSGTTEETFQVDNDNSGPRIKNNAGVLEVRNTSDAAYANLKALGLELTAALVLAGSITGATTGAFSGAVTIGGALGVTGAITGGATSSIPIDNEATADAIKTRDHEATGLLPEAVNVVYGTGSPPAAGGVPDGTLFFKYTA